MFWDLYSNISSKIAQTILSPFLQYPLVGLILFSIILGVLLLIAYGKISNQNALKKVKTDIFTNLIETVLFRHDLSLSLKAQAKLFYLAGYYFRLALFPLLILALPCILILAHLDAYFGHQALLTNQALILSMKLKDPNVAQQIELKEQNQSQQKILEISPSLKIAKEQSIIWRINALVQGESALIITIGASTFSLPLAFGFHNQPKYSTIAAKSWRNLIHPSPFVLQNQIEQINLDYKSAHYKILGMNMHWLVVFFLVSLVAGLVTSKILRISI